jgi:hypothetical protein
MRFQRLVVVLALFALQQVGSMSGKASAAEPATASAAAGAAAPDANSGYQVINAGGPGCPNALSPDAQKLLEEYRAFHYCFTYQFRADHDFGTDITNAVYDVMNIVIPITNYIELYQPEKNTIRFQVKDGKNYRLYKYWAHDLSNIPPPGEYTDHKFVNPQLRSVDYFLKLQQRGTGKNARIGGVAEAVFVPDELFEKAKQGGFLN